MGCGSSRAGQSELVVLCQQRKSLIRAAGDRRYALSAAHDAYFRELAAVGGALGRFVEEELSAGSSSSSPPGSPVLTIPPSEGKGSAVADEEEKVSSSSVTPLSHSLSEEGSHRPLSSGSEARSPGKGAKGKAEGGEEKPPSFDSVPSPRNNSTMSSSAIPSVAYDDPAGLYDGNGHGYGFGYGYPIFGFPFGSEREELPYSDGPGMTPQLARAPPTPPPPAEDSPWEFFDPFLSYEQFLLDSSQRAYGGYSNPSSPHSSEVREKEGIPDLEDETEVEATKVVEKVKKVGNRGGPIEAYPSTGSLKEERAQGTGKEEQRESEIGRGSNLVVSDNRSSRDGEGSNGKKKAVTFEEDNSLATEQSAPTAGKSLSAKSSGAMFAAHGTRDVIEVVKEIKEQFEMAAACGGEVSWMLETGKIPYGIRAKMLGAISSRIPDAMTLPVSASLCLPTKRSRRRTTNSSGSNVVNGSSKNHFNMKSGNLSSTLEKLYVWEKKLCKEVRDEEKLRVIYDKRIRKLKSLDERGADSDEIQSTESSIRKLHTKISIIIKSVDAISNRMHKIRDEELQPQLIELIQGLVRMWKCVLHCHQRQLLALVDSKSHHLKAKNQIQKVSVAKTTRELERELAKWYRCFNSWISTQKSYTEALNGWLLKWLPQEQEEETPDGVPPFSPGRLGAPAAFIISNDWSQVNNIVSEDKVSKAMDHFSDIVHKLRNSQEAEYRQKLKAEHHSKIYDRRLKVNQKQIGGDGDLEVVSVTENDLEQRHDPTITLDMARQRKDQERAKHEALAKQVQFLASTTLRTGLVPVFEELLNFFSDNLKAYEGVRIPVEDEAA